jgi:adenylyltransferase/sulfurtransferase
VYVLAHKHVVIVGAGGLGCPALWQLAAAGVGRITIMDHDVVELSNLNRQVLYRSDDVGQPKAPCAAARVRVAFPAARIDALAARLTRDNLAAFFSSADFVIDATDGVAAKFLINDGAVELGRPFSHAGILGFHGQTMTVVPGRSACLRCLFPEPPAADDVPTCQEAGILGAVAGVIGSLQAQAAISYLRGHTVTDRLLTFDGLAGRWRAVSLHANPRCPLPGCRQARSARSADAPERTAP